MFAYLGRLLLPPSPPAEKATAREHKTRKACAGDGAGDRIYLAQT
jgi:hypothetical protein